MLIPSPPEIASGFRFIDKVEHFAAFFVLAVLLHLSFKNGQLRKPVYFMIIAASLGLYGIFIEIIQQFTGRNTELSDVLADLAGVAAGCIVSLFFL